MNIKGVCPQEMAWEVRNIASTNVKRWLVENGIDVTSLEEAQTMFMGTPSRTSIEMTLWDHQLTPAQLESLAKMICASFKGQYGVILSEVGTNKVLQEHKVFTDA